MGRITFLGTGDPLNGERAQTSLALALAGGDVLLIDTSSGTILLRQLEQADIALERVRHIIISHRHFDHAGGLAPLLVAMVPVTVADVTIHATQSTLDALHELLAVSIPGVEDWMGKRLHWHALTTGKPVTIGDATVTPFAVEHGIDCTGVKIEQDGRSAVFTSDTRPCPNVATWAENADLLIHEAYGPDSDAETTHYIGHSTAADAGAVARVADARRLILTHFRSQHFADPNALAAEAAVAYGGAVEVAQDLEEVEF
jgi:ribonuclease BN (tRNA processing enzyme)